MKFKEFLLREEFGLGDIGSKIDTLFNSPQFGAFINSDQMSNISRPENGRPQNPENIIEVPQVERTGRISVILKNKNPIYVRLSDGTEASFTYDEFRRIEGEPALGKTMTIIFQRNPKDLGQNYSKIDKCIVRD